MKATVIVLIFAVLNKMTTAMVKKNFYINIAMTWEEAQAYCQASYTDLSTINSEVEYEIFRFDIDSSSNDGWIGLRNIGYGWHWSDGSKAKFQKWTKVSTSDSHKCAKMKSNDWNWDQHNCNESKPFYCYEWIPGITLVRIKMSWENALIYCRTYYSDLASLNTTRSLLDVKNKTKTTVWTGLRFLAGSWFWVTRDPLELQDPLHSCPTEPYRCGARNPEADRWENRDCEENLMFLCNDKIEMQGFLPSDLDSESGNGTDPFVSEEHIDPNKTTSGILPDDQKSETNNGTVWWTDKDKTLNTTDMKNSGTSGSTTNRMPT